MISNKILSFISSLMLFSSSLTIAAERIKVVTSLPDFAWMAQEIGGARVTAIALLKGSENPHYVDARPDFVQKVSDADLVCIVGLDLEVGYMPAVLSKSGNAKVQPGGKGYCELGNSVSVLDKPSGKIDRSMGDVHPAGNPHFFLSPKSMSQAAEGLAEALIRVDPSYSKDYQSNLKILQASLQAISERTYQQLEPLRAAQKDQALIIEYHREFAYFLAEYGLKSMGSIEEKPGVPPSAGRLGEIAQLAKKTGVKLALGADYNPRKTLDRFSEISSIPLAIVPTMMQPSGENKSYAAVQDFIAKSLLSAWQSPASKK